MSGSGSSGAGGSSGTGTPGDSWTSLGDRVDRYHRLDYPDQQAHVATSDLVRDLWAEIQRLRKTVLADGTAHGNL